MTHVPHPTAADFAHAAFRKSSRSGQTSGCVEIGWLDHQGHRFVAVQDTKARHAGRLVFTEDQFAALRLVLRSHDR
ncbi:DUF397 domain-containing protein [Actinosynnema sp. NPDC023587]|uniref:DUF397 domain-containing protein n=1 Tax=Actinosynnema sp. NPDC023587 TaxID=3154695 RepID=UPI0034093483